MKKIIAFVGLLITMMTTVTTHAETIDFYNEMSENLNIIQVYDIDDLNSDILTNRSENGTIIIEKIIGQVVNANGDGVILNTTDNHNYISYKNVHDVKPGDIVLTYCIYNPDTDGEDDIMDRFDYIIDRTE